MKRRTTVLASIVAFLVLLAAVAYVALDPERKTLDDAARAAAPGKFVRLPDGVTHYDLSGADSGRTVVLLSGATVPYYLWDPTAQSLVGRGFRVLRYDYFGRGFSDRPTMPYDLDAFDRQLTALLDTLGIRGRVDVAGVSMGGVIAADFADRHSDRVRSLVLVDPAFGHRRSLPFLLRIPGAAEFVGTIASHKMARGQLDDFLRPELHPDWVRRYEAQMQYKGFRRSVLATTRGDVLRRPAASFTRLARGNTPILLLWGKADRTVAFSESAVVRTAFPRAEFHAIDGAAHLPQIEQAAVVESILLAFLRAH